MATDGPRGATEAFLRGVGGDVVYDSLDPALRERLLENGDVFFSIEISPLIAYEQTPDELASMPVARAVTVGADDRRPEAPAHWRYETAEWHVDASNRPAETTPFIRPSMKDLELSTGLLVAW